MYLNLINLVCLFKSIFNITCFQAYLLYWWYKDLDEDIILFLEYDLGVENNDINRVLRSIFHSHIKPFIKWIIFWRPQKSSLEIEKLIDLLPNILPKSMSSIPIFGQANFWHVNPIATIPIWSIWNISVTKNNISRCITNQI